MLVAADDAFIAWDAHGAILEWNPQAAAIFGWTRTETLGRDVITTIVAPCSRSQFQRIADRTVTSAEHPAAERLELVGLLRDGSEIPVELTMWAVPVGDSYSFSALVHSSRARQELECSLRTITQCRELETERERIVSDLGTANRGLEGALLREQDTVRELSDLLKLKDEFVAMVSHELRTPLTSIVGYAEMLDDGELGELLDDQHRVLIVMDQNARRLVALVEDLLTIGRIEAGSFNSERVPLELGPLIAAAGEAMLPSARTKAIVLDLDVDPGLGVVAADAAQLDRLLLNLLSNAVKFTPAGGRVELRARAESDAVIIDIADNGVGIPLAEQGQVFARFFRAQRTVKEAVPGTGLGLAIVKSIVDQHDGRITLVSEPGVGTQVSVTLPRALGNGSTVRLPANRARQHVPT